LAFLRTMLITRQYKSWFSLKRCLAWRFDIPALLAASLTRLTYRSSNIAGLVCLSKTEWFNSVMTVKGLKHSRLFYMTNWCELICSHTQCIWWQHNKVLLENYFEIMNSVCVCVWYECLLIKYSKNFLFLLQGLCQKGLLYIQIVYPHEML
jgi:hypothetical protein